ncbi:hypothetical protein C8R43DRAFT_993814 [Mycena crocata]|nr:hypothetical protein C8R43DRAFT_993814 [Mycena crocata]
MALDAAFDLVSQNLFAIGALSIDEFLTLPPEPPKASVAQSAYNTLPASRPVLSASASASVSSKARNSTPPAPKSAADATNWQNLARLHQTFQRTFGPSNPNGLKFDFTEEAIDKKQCILTVTRPEGVVRVYTTKPVFRRKNEAKAAVATVAIENGVLDFIVHGDSDALKAKKGLLLAPLQNDKQLIASTSRSVHGVLDLGPPPLRNIEEIQRCCEEWRGPSVRPCWLNFDDPKAWNRHGAILKIRLAAHSYRVYSCEPMYASPSEAREHCAEIAIRENVLEFIKHGNGQIVPKSDSDIVHDPSSGPPRSLQAFYESLPRPFEEPFGEKTAAEINAPGWFNSLLVGAKGTRFTADYHPISATTDGPVPLQGCVLRLNRPGECRSYLADPRFSTQKDAKSAVVLLALSQGAGKYIRECGAAVDALITPEMRRFVLTYVLPALAAQTQRISGVAPQFDYSNVDDAYGCRLQVNFDASGIASREYTTPAQYRSKSDAKVAVAYLAAQQGVIDLLRFDGKPIPVDESPAFVFQDGVPQFAQPPKKKKKKRNKGDEGQAEGPSAKKQKIGAEAGGGGHARPMNPAATGTASLPLKPMGSQFSGPAYYGSGRVSGPTPMPTQVARNPVPVRDDCSLRLRRSLSMEEGEISS